MTNTQNEDLEKLVKQRKQEAKQIRLKLTTVIETLGEIRERGEWDNYTETGEYNNNELHIRHYFERRCVGSDCEILSNEENIIRYKNKKVYVEEDKDFKIYRPELWEKSLDELYNQALKSIEKNQNKEIKER